MSLLLALGFVATASAQQVTVIGGTDGDNDEDRSLKLVALKVTESVVVLKHEFQVYGSRNAEGLKLVLYERDGDTNTWNIRQNKLPPTLPAKNGRGAYVDSGAVQWVLLAGRTYAVGAWIGPGWGYYYSSKARADKAPFATTLGSLRFETDAQPGTINAGLEDYIYRQRLTTVLADADGDGVISAEWGGMDCDDDNADVTAAVEEIPYDGIDQDCDGLDLIDVDGDGVDAAAAGGTDCDDTNAGIAPGLTEICGDGIDQNCIAGDLPCENGGTDTDTTGGPGGSEVDGPEALAAACEGCDSSSTRGSSALVGLLGLTLLRRRRTA